MVISGGPCAGGLARPLHAYRRSMRACRGPLRACRHDLVCAHAGGPCARAGGLCARAALARGRTERGGRGRRVGGGVRGRRRTDVAGVGAGGAGVDGSGADGGGGWGRGGTGAATDGWRMERGGRGRRMGWKQATRPGNPAPPPSPRQGHVRSSPFSGARRHCAHLHQRLRQGRQGRTVADGDGGERGGRTRAADGVEAGDTTRQSCPPPSPGNLKPVVLCLERLHGGGSMGDLSAQT